MYISQVRSSILVSPKSGACSQESLLDARDWQDPRVADWYLNWKVACASFGSPRILFEIIH